MNCCTRIIRTATGWLCSCLAWNYRDRQNMGLHSIECRCGRVLTFDRGLVVRIFNPGWGSTKEQS